MLPPNDAPLPGGAFIEIDRTPTGVEEKEVTFSDEEDHRKRRLDNDSNEQDMGERIRYASNAYAITQAWVGFLMVITLAQICFSPIKLGLSDAAFIAVFTTTTASVFGFWLLVGNYLFRNK